MSRTEIRQAQWYHSDNNWIKLNCDSTYKRSTSKTKCESLFRYSSWSWMRGYVRKIGVCDVLSIDIWAMLHGLRLAQIEWFTNLTFKSDSKILIDIVSQESLYDKNLTILVCGIRKMTKKDWHIKFNHIRHEGKCCANWTTNYNELKTFLIDDRSKVTSIKQVKISR